MIVHMCPLSGSGEMPCCGRTPFAVSALDRITFNPLMVDCGGGPLDSDEMIREMERLIETVATEHGLTGRQATEVVTAAYTLGYKHAGAVMMSAVLQ